MSTRDFRMETVEKMHEYVESVENMPWYKVPGDWIGDGWNYLFSNEKYNNAFYGCCESTNYSKDINDYLDKVIDNQNIDQDELNNILKNVDETDAKYGRYFEQVRDLYNTFLTKMKRVNSMLNPTAMNLSSEEYNKFFQKINDSYDKKFNDINDSLNKDMDEIDLEDNESMCDGLLDAEDFMSPFFKLFGSDTADENYKVNKEIEEKQIQDLMNYYMDGQRNSEHVYMSEEDARARAEREVYGRLIYDQEDLNVCNYQFGKAKFNDVGCELAAIYNASMLVRTEDDRKNDYKNNPKMSDIIYDYEKNGGRMNNGKWGTNPAAVEKYFKDHDMKTTNISDVDDFKKQAKTGKDDVYIVSSWNRDDGRVMHNGLHTYAVKSNGDGTFSVYNGYDTNIASETVSDIDTYFKGNSFIQAVKVEK